MNIDNLWQKKTIPWAYDFGRSYPEVGAHDVNVDRGDVVINANQHWINVAGCGNKRTWLLSDDHAC